jgi:hypothetical protein
MQEYRMQKTASASKKGVGQHAGMVGQHKQEWWVNMRRNLQSDKHTNLWAQMWVLATNL